jgi:hypothetical protein
MNLQLNDPGIPGPGEMISESHHSNRTSSPHSMTGSPIISSGDPHHYRTPSLGEIHQELEQEQEAQVVCYCVPKIKSFLIKNRTDFFR